MKLCDELVMNPLKLDSADCSAFGNLVLQYLRNNPQTNMSQLAKQIGISRAGLGWICLKQNNPDEETARKIAQIIGVDLTKIARLIHENKLEKLALRNGLNYATKFSRRSVVLPVPVEDAIAGLNAVFHASHYVIRSVPEADKPSDFQMYKQAYEVVKGQFLNHRKISQRQQSASRMMRV